MTVVIGGYTNCKEASQNYDLVDLFSQIAEGSSTHFTLNAENQLL